VDENFNQEIKCCMSLVIENAAFYDPEPEVKISRSRKIFADLDSEMEA
jgi:hypothetical protein